MAGPDQIKMFIGEEKIQKIKDIDFDGDVLINGFPRTGTTWFQEAVWLIMNDGDVSSARQSHVGCRVPFLESHGFEWEKNVDSLEEFQHPRIMKTHFPPKTFKDKLPKMKMIIPIRNPKDTIVSQHNFFTIARFIPFELPLHNVVGAFLDDSVYGLLNVFGNFFPWYMQAMAIREDKNVLLVKFEDVVREPKSIIKEIAAFLGKKLDDVTVAAIAEHCSFEKMKANPMVNHTNQEIFDSSKGDFFNKGEVGQWRNVLNNEHSKMVDKVYKKTLGKVGMEFTYDSTTTL